MSNSVFEAAFTGMMASGIPQASAKAMGAEGQQALGPLRSVLAFASAVPASPNAGDSYILTSGIFQNQIAVFAIDGVWHYSTPSEGDVIYVQANTVWYTFIGSAWVPFSSPAFGTYRIVTGPTVTLSITDYIIGVDASGGETTLNLLACLVVPGRTFRIIKTDSSGNAVNITPNGVELINGVTPYALFAQYQAVDIFANSTGWWVF